MFTNSDQDVCSTAEPETTRSSAEAVAETLLGGAGNDLGGRATAVVTTALLGAGDDTFVWDPGDGSDIVDGEAGTDTRRFNGAAVAEHVNGFPRTGTHVQVCP